MASTVFAFGKHRGRSFKEVAEKDPSYCNWATKQENPSGQLKDFALFVQGSQPQLAFQPAPAGRACATPQNSAVSTPQLPADLTLVCELLQDGQFAVRAERPGSTGHAYMPPHVWSAIGRLDESSLLLADKRGWAFPLVKYNTVLNGLEALGRVEGIPPWVVKLLEWSRKQPGDEVQEARMPPRLLPYQVQGVEYGMSRRGRCLIADEMGLGKTLQALALAAQYREDWPVLIVCPSSLRWLWKEQALEWLHEILRPADVQVIRKGAEAFNREAKMWVISYNLLATDANRGKFSQRPDGTPHGLVIVDESHNIKDWSAARTKALVPMLRQASRAILLSGTPTRNTADELHPQMCALLPDVAKLSDFRARYCIVQQQSFYGRQVNRVVGARCAAELNFLLSSTVMIRRQKKEVLSQLPAKRRQRVPLDVDSKVLKDLDLRSLADGGAEMDRTGPNIFMRIAKAKLKAVREYLSEVLDRAEDKMIIFAHHTLMLDEVSDLLSKCLPKMDCSFVRIDGATNQAKRPELVRKFQEDPDCRIALLSITACGEGLTMTAASLVIFAELYWVPGAVEQAEARAHRLGSTHSKVVVEFLVLPNSPDEYIYKSLERKKQDTSHVLDGVAESMNVAQADVPVASKLTTKTKRSAEETESPPTAAADKKGKRSKTGTAAESPVERSKVNTLLKAIQAGRKALDSMSQTADGLPD